MNKSHYCLTSSLGFLVKTASKGLSNKLEQNFKKAGMSITYEQWTVLVSLWGADGRAQQCLAAHTGRDQTCMSRLLDNLLRYGLIERKADEYDRRTKRIYLTEAGKKLQEECIAIAKATCDEVIQSIEKEDYETFEKVLIQINKKL